MNPDVTAPFQDGSDVVELPVTLAQRRFWVLDQLEPGNPAYNIAVRFRIEGPLDTDLFDRSFNEIVRRHEVLRTTFAMVGDEPVQLVAPELKAVLRSIDLRDLAPQARIEESERLIVEEARAGFDLARGPLIRAGLLKLEDELHVFFVTVHHSVCDGWSIGIIVDELAAIYEAFAKGTVASVPGLPVQYGDFAVWQQQWLRGDPLKEQLSYWKRRLADLTPLDLPADFPRTNGLSATGEISSILLPKRLTERLQELSKQHDCTLFMTMLAAFNVLLSRYTGQTDIVLGTPVAGRNSVELEHLIGVFINSLVLRTDLAGNPSFLEILRRVRETALGALANAEVPFEQVVDELRPKRDLTRTPLFQVNFIFQRDFVHPQRFAGLTLTAIPSRSPGAIYDLNVFFVERAEGWRLSCEYNAGLFHPETIVRMLQHYTVLLEGIATNPNVGIEALPLLPPEELQQLLTVWNDTQTGYPKSACFHELFEAQVTLTPGAVAVTWRNRSLTYAELNERANRLAHRLQELGVGPDVLVGICMERCPDMLVALLGVMKAGGAYLPLDPGFPAERLAFMLEDAKVSVLLTHEEAADVLPGGAVQRIILDRDWGTVSQHAADNPTSGVHSGHLAYVLYTSGSTGKPKGVQIPHGALVNFLWSTSKRPGLGGADVFLSVTTLSFDIAGMELYLPLLVGARVVLASRDQAVDGQLLVELLTQCGATLMQATPATWRLLLETDWRGRDGFRVLVGGEALPRDLADRLLDRCPEVWNLYGPTETTIWSTIYRVVPGDGPVPIGRPIANTRMYILDPIQRPVPIGVAGELHIGGDGLARGYLCRPELTAERFIPDPFATEEGGRLYKTGDLARYLPNGNIVYLGRMDNQVKVRGFRIELQEIESALKEHPRVANAIVVARTTQTGDSRLAAYLVAPEGEAPDPAECRKLLRRTLPDYMLPSSFTVMEILPLTPNGKIDRRALPDPEDEREPAGTGYVAPRTPMEKLLAEVWEEKLGISSVGIHDNFFDLGGHSLLAMRVVAQIERRTGLLMAPRQFIMATLEQIAAAYVPAEEPSTTQSDQVLGKQLNHPTRLFSRKNNKSIKERNLTLERIIRRIPLISDYYSYHWHFPRTITACRGVYSSFIEALQAVPKNKLAGYNQKIIGQHQSVAQLTARSEIGLFHSIDYPVLLWLKAAFVDSTKVFDLGGNVGLAYYAYRKFMSYPGDLQWLVCEIPEIANAGKGIAIQQGCKNLSFTTEFSQADGSEILLTCGTLQYLGATLSELLETLHVKPRHLLIQNVPFYDGESYTTLQNIGYAYCPYKIQNRAEFISALLSHGYGLVDSWVIHRSFSVPFHPERFVPAYHGFYLRLNQKPI